MNEQLRKAIEESTKIEFVDSHETVICHSDHNASQAKLLRVIELLVQQRDDAILNCMYETGYGIDRAAINQAEDISRRKNAELIAALEEEK